MAGGGMTCRSAAAIMAGRGLEWPCACGRWLPVWLPESRSNADVRMLIAGGRPVSVALVSQIEHGETTSFEVIARYVEALGGRLDLVADFGDRNVRLPVTDTPPPHDSNHAGQPPPRTSRLRWRGY